MEVPILIGMVILLAVYLVFRDLKQRETEKDYRDHIKDLELRLQSRDSDAYAAWKAEMNQATSEESPEVNKPLTDKLTDKQIQRTFKPIEEVEREDLIPTTEPEEAKE